MALGTANACRSAAVRTGLRGLNVDHGRSRKVQQVPTNLSVSNLLVSGSVDEAEDRHVRAGRRHRRHGRQAERADPVGADRRTRRFSELRHQRWIGSARTSASASPRAFRSRSVPRRDFDDEPPGESGQQSTSHCCSSFLGSVEGVAGSFSAPSSRQLSTGMSTRLKPCPHLHRWKQHRHETSRVQFDRTFYPMSWGMDVTDNSGQPIAEGVIQSAAVRFGPVTLAQPCRQLHPRRPWLELLTDDVDGATEHLAAHCVLVQDELEPFPSDQRVFSTTRRGWADSPAPDVTAPPACDEASSATAPSHTRRSSPAAYRTGPDPAARPSPRRSANYGNAPSIHRSDVRRPPHARTTHERTSPFQSASGTCNYG